MATVQTGNKQSTSVRHKTRVNGRPLQKQLGVVSLVDFITVC